MADQKCGKTVNDHGFVPDYCGLPLGHAGECKWIEPEDAAPAEQPFGTGTYRQTDTNARVTTEPAAAQVDAEQSLQWLNEFFGVFQGASGNAVRFVYSEQNGAWLVDRNDKRWRLSEVLAACAAHVTKGLRQMNDWLRTDLAREVKAHSATKKVTKGLEAELREYREQELIEGLLKLKLEAAEARNLELMTERDEYKEAFNEQNEALAKQTLEMNKIAKAVAHAPTVTGLQEGCVKDHSLIHIAILDAQATFKDMVRRAEQRLAEAEKALETFREAMRASGMRDHDVCGEHVWRNERAEVVERELAELRAQG